MEAMNILTALKGVAELVRPKPSPRTLWLSAGHSNAPGKDQGSEYRNTGFGLSRELTVTEGAMAADLRLMIYKILQDAGFGDRVKLDDSRNVTAETFKQWRGMVRKQDLAIDIHFNSFTNKTASGTEVLVPDTYSKMEFAVAGRLAQVTHDVMGIPLRGGRGGVKTESESKRGSLLWMKLPCETILWEVCFPSNPAEQDKYWNSRRHLAAEAANLAIQWLNEEI